MTTMDLWGTKLLFLACSFYVLSTTIADWNVLLSRRTNSNSNVDLRTLWENSTLSNKSNMYLHKSHVQDLLTYDYFRSPLIETWNALNIQQVKIVIFDSYGQELLSYMFEGQNTTALTWFTGAVSVSKYLLESASYTAGNWQIHSRQEPSLFLFLSISGARSDHVMVSRGKEGFHVTVPEFLCVTNYSGSVLHEEGNITSFIDCVIVCYGHSASVAMVTSTSNSDHTCKCYANFTSTAADTSITVCGTPCSWNSSEGCGNDLYGVIFNISTFEEHLLNLEKQNETLTLEVRNITSETYDFGDTVFLSRLAVSSNQTCRLRLFYGTDTCSTNVTMEAVQVEGEKVFMENSTYYVGILAVRCITLVSQDVNSTCKVDFERKTGPAVFAPYIAVLASWEEEICQYTNIMTPSLLNPSAVQVYYGNHTQSQANMSALHLNGSGLVLQRSSWPLPDPKVVAKVTGPYRGTVRIHWIEIVANLSYVDIRTTGRCLNGSDVVRGETVHFSGSTIMNISWSTEDVPTCVDEIEISLTGGSNSEFYSLKIGVFGCINQTLSSNCDAVNIFNEEVFPFDQTVLYRRLASVNGSDFGMCGSGLPVPDSPEIENPIVFVNVAENPLTFANVDSISLQGDISNVSLAVASRYSAEFVPLNFTMSDGKGNVTFDPPIEVHTLKLSASNTMFKIDISACIINDELIETGSLNSTRSERCPGGGGGGNGSTTNPACCPCPLPGTPLTVAEATRKAEEIRNALKVNTRKLSSFIRARTSAKDDRPSAKAIGSLGVILMTCFVCMLVAMDIPNLFKVIVDRLNPNQIKAS